jgi:endoglucanase
MRYNNPSQQPMTGSVIGNTSDLNAATTAQFGKFWEELAGRFKNNPNVIFGIMNEPHDMPTSLVLRDDQAAIDGIRRSGARQLILAPGIGYTGGHAWLQSSQGDKPSGNYLYKLHDPIENTAMDIHEYLDSDFSGSHIVCSQNASYNLHPLTGWLRKLLALLYRWEPAGKSRTQQCRR